LAVLQCCQCTAQKNHVPLFSRLGHDYTLHFIFAEASSVVIPIFMSTADKPGGAASEPGDSSHAGAPSLIRATSLKALGENAAVFLEKAGPAVKRVVYISVVVVVCCAVLSMCVCV
jgi:hypothetical protein